MNDKNNSALEKILPYSVSLAYKALLTVDRVVYFRNGQKHQLDQKPTATFSRQRSKHIVKILLHASME